MSMREACVQQPPAPARACPAKYKSRYLNLI